MGKKEGEKSKGIECGRLLEKERTCVKSNEGTWLTARKKNIF